MSLNPANGRRRLTQAEAEVFVSAHEKFITGKQGGKRAVLRFLDLSGLDLTGRNLNHADFTGSVFDGARMAKVQLERAALFGCEMRKADLRHANLKRADLRGVSLRGANLSMADLSGADFREGRIGIPHPRKGLDVLTHEDRAASMENTLFRGAKLDDSQMEGVVACKADFSDCSL